MNNCGLWAYITLYAHHAAHINWVYINVTSRTQYSHKHTHTALAVTPTTNLWPQHQLFTNEVPNMPLTGEYASKFSVLVGSKCPRMPGKKRANSLSAPHLSLALLLRGLWRQLAVRAGLCSIKTRPHLICHLFHCKYTWCVHTVLCSPWVLRPAVLSVLAARHILGSSRVRILEPL